MSQPSPVSTENRNPPRSAALVVLPAVTALGLATAVGLAVYRYFQPRWYVAGVVFEIRSKPSPKGRQSLTPPPEQGADPHLDILQEPAFLDEVVKELELTKAYGRPAGSPIPPGEARAELRRSMQLQVGERGTPQLVTIRVYAQDAFQAANVANTLAKNFRDRRLAAESLDLDGGPAAQAERVSQLRTRVRSALDEMTNVRERDQITDTDPESPNAVLSGENVAAYREAKAKYLQAQGLYESAEVALKKSVMEELINHEPVIVRQRAEPPLAPLPWWRGDPRR